MPKFLRNILLHRWTTVLSKETWRYMQQTGAFLVRIEFRKSTVVTAIAFDDFLVAASTKATMNEFFWPKKTKIQHKTNSKVETIPHMVLSLQNLWLDGIFATPAY